jgi:hypothetical protein
VAGLWAGLQTGPVCSGWIGLGGLIFEYRDAKARAY